MSDKIIADTRFMIVPFLFVIMFLIAVPAYQIGIAAQDKMKPEEIVAKHLESIGSAEQRSPSRSRTVTGTSLMSLRTGGRGQADGPVLIASKGNTVLINATFESPDYPFERISYDGDKLVVKQFRPGSRSPIGEFFLSYDEIFKEGIIGGTLSAAWSMLHLDERNPKIKFDGTDRINEKKVYKLRYEPRKGSDLKIKLYFDAETFRHIRTEYERVIAAQMGANARDSVSQRETRFKIVENFSDFVTAAGLTVPQKYSIEYTVFSRNNPLVIDWTFDFKKFAFNQPVNISEFQNEK
jgi:outer membrane lipoprotein-sorting protein